MAFIGSFEGFQLVVSVAAFIARWKHKTDIMKVIGVCALLGRSIRLRRESGKTDAICIKFADGI